MYETYGGAPHVNAVLKKPMIPVQASDVARCQDLGVEPRNQKWAQAVRIPELTSPSGDSRVLNRPAQKFFASGSYAAC